MPKIMIEIDNDRYSLLKNMAKERDYTVAALCRRTIKAFIDKEAPKNKEWWDKEEDSTK